MAAKPSPSRSSATLPFTTTTTRLDSATYVHSRQLTQHVQNRQAPKKGPKELDEDDKAFLEKKRAGVQYPAPYLTP
ncbi:hypothetical protein N656DRAFT_779534 [Canariomyces notabilis]|uniref:Uncharacterized protein n=1 Tax=Canariomyces notabilis TaxID=2074819 RepID=A0AAN6TCU0_9PEZI|nr:hypothetical protein N656DRAFT_779534 [Canariomyces arenarius]